MIKPEPTSLMTLEQREAAVTEILLIVPPLRGESTVRKTLSTLSDKELKSLVSDLRGVKARADEIVREGLIKDPEKDKLSAIQARRAGALDRLRKLLLLKPHT